MKNSDISNATSVCVRDRISFSHNLKNICHLPLADKYGLDIIQHRYNIV